MAYPKRVWVKLNRPEGEVNLRDKQGRDIGDIPEGMELTVTGIDAQGRYSVEAFIASGVTQETDPNASTILNWHWPTQYRFVTQAWGNDPAFYKPYGLPGHEGVDIRAYHGTEVYAVWDATVTRIDEPGLPGYGNYGYSMRIRYEWQGITHEVTYAHGVIGSAKFNIGDRVRRGDVLMLADATGNVQQGRAHLHLSLKLLGKTYTDIGPNGLVRTWPNNLHDPTPYLFPDPTPQYATLPEGHALKGLHGPADPGTWAWDQFNLLDVVQQCGFESVKVLCPGTSAGQVQTLRAKGAKFIYARLFAKMDERRGDSLGQRATWFFNEVISALRDLYNAGLRYVEIHNEPNLVNEGLGTNWNNGTEFATWFMLVAQFLETALPGIQCGFPGLSPGGTIPGIRQDSTTFFNQAQRAVSDADWLGFHAYYGGDGSSWSTMLQQINTFAEANKGKIILVTEWSNNAEAISKEIKGPQYKLIYDAAKQRLKPNIGTLSVFVLWSSGAFQHETLVEKDGTRSAIVQALQ